MKKYVPSILFLIAFTLIFSSCAKKEMAVNQPQVNKAYFAELSDPHLNKNVKLIVNGSIFDEINEVQDSKIIFKKNSQAAQSLIVGNILAADTSKTFPYGTLRKIISRVDNPTDIVFVTEAASLNDVFLSGSIHIEHELSKESAKTIKGGRPSAIEPVELSVSYKFNDDIILKGSGTAKPKFTFDWRKQEGSLEPNYVKTTLDLDTDYYMGLSITEGVYDDEKMIKGFDFGVIRFSVYGFPISFRTELDFYCKIKVTNPIDLSFGFEGKKSFHIEGIYQNEEWNAESNSTDLTINFKPTLQIKKDGKLTMSVLKPVFEIHPYDIDGLALYLGGDIGSNVTFDCSTKKWTGDAYLKGIVGVKTNFIKFAGMFKLKQKSDSYYEFDIAKTNLGQGTILCGQQLISGTVNLESVKVGGSSDSETYECVATINIVGVPSLDDTRFSYNAFIVSPGSILSGGRSTLNPEANATFNNKLLIGTVGSPPGEYFLVLQVLPKSLSGFEEGTYYGTCCGPCYQNKFSLGTITFDKKGMPLGNIPKTIVIPDTKFYICNP